MVSRRRIVSALTTALIVGGLTGIAGCTDGHSTAPKTPVSGLNLDAEVDAATGRIILPFDRFVLTEQETDDLGVAGSVALAACAKADGVDFAVAKNPYSPLYDVSTRWGVWVEKYAARFGFVAPMTDADLRANSIVGAPPDRAPDSAEQPDLSGNKAVSEHNGNLTPADQSVVDRCVTTQAVTAFDPPSLVTKGPWNEKLNDVSAKFDSLDEVKDVFSEYDACLIADGLQLSKGSNGDPRSLDSVVGADASTISEEQISLALRVVACKTKVDLVPRLATIMAAQQAPIIEQYGSELMAQRKAIDKAVADARALIASTATP